MLLVVLFTLLLLAGILSASMRLGLSSRQGSADQAATIKAQYAAESAVSLSRSRLRDIQAILTKENVAVPGLTTVGQLKLLAEKFCGNNTWVNISQTGMANLTQCKVTPSSTTSAQFDVFAQVIKAQAYTANLPLAEQSGAGSSSWWKTQLSSKITLGSGGAQASYTIQPTRVVKTGDASFRFFFKVGSLTTRGTAGASTRVLSGAADANGEWWLDINLPGFTDNVLFTNHHRQKTSSSSLPDVFFTVQQFNGPVHTNEKFLFGSGATAMFTKKLTSAGCTNLDSLPVGALTCTQQAGVYLGSGNLNTASSGDINGYLKGKVDEYTDVTWNQMQSGQPDFTAAYRPMPTTATTLSADSQASGLNLPTAVRAITLKAADSNGTSPGTYSTTTKSWTPTPTHQYITVTNWDNSTTQYRYASDKTLYMKNASGNWVFVKSNFNGVIFGEDAIGFTDWSGVKRGGVSGPGRDGSGNAYPALAPFAQMTVAAQNNVNISGDLAMSQQPLVCDEAAANFSTCQADANTRGNVLGLYTQKGDISITKNAPNNVNIHAMTMSAEGQVNVDGHDSGSPRGAVNLIGGIVENYYGAFGTFSGNTPLTGYSRNFSYDRRFLDQAGFGPPSFLNSPAWTAVDARSEDDKRLAAGQKPLRLDSIVWKQDAAGAY